jgi:hypothetical protein
LSFDLEHFEIPDMLRCGREVREAARGRTRMESGADAMARHLYDAFRDGDGVRQCALVRFYKTHPYPALEPDLRRFADQMLGRPPADPAALKCLTLLATVGEEPAWCDRKRSQGHQAIPLASEEMIEQAPMIAQLIRQFGLEVRQVVRPEEDLLQARGGRSFNVFHVEEALGSPYIPAQREFVEQYGVRSVVGFGGALRSAELFAVILFTRVYVSAMAAERFRNIALDVKYSLFSYGEDEVFAQSGAVTSSDGRSSDIAERR